MDALQHPSPFSPGTADGLLTFALRQARPGQLDIAPEGDGRTPVPVRPTGRAVDLPRGLHRLLSGAAYPNGTVPEATPVLRRVLGTIAASGPQRFEVRSAVNPHRAYPASHCFYTAQVFLLTDGAAWHYDVAGHRLWPVGPGPVGDLERELDGTGGAALAVIVHVPSLPLRYRELRWALSLCEAGHLTELLAEVGHAHGLPVREYPCDGEALFERLGLDPGDGWIQVGVVGLGTRSTPPEGAAGPVRERGRSGVAASTSNWAEVLFERSAGRANKGFGAAPGPLPEGVAEAIGPALEQALGPAPRTPDRGGADVLLLAQRVPGLDPGCYRVRPGLSPERLGPGPGMEAVQRAYSYPPTQMDVAGCPAALLFVHDFEAQVAVGGEPLMREAQRQLGAAAQAVGMAMTALGVFLRPARSFDPDLLAAAFGLPEARLPSYLALLGVNRYTDLLLDVRP
ncbi:hypothetical protein [Nocardiopsis sp. NPDC006832]|uniref:hypothetical protein n=1 Tax=Nocardiopsis sp. NPDC006832 TaxID=3157188 RepID=UPI0033E13A90